MAITNEGLKHIAAAMVGTVDLFDTAHAYLEVGDGDAAFSAAQTTLQGANVSRQPMDIGYPIVDGASIRFKATFPPEAANFAWKEWGVFNASSGGLMLNRTVENNSTKLATQTWVLHVVITFISD